MKISLQHIMYSIKELFAVNEPYGRKEYASSRRWFTLDGITANIIGSLVGGSILAGYLAALGVSESLNGIIAAIPLLLQSLQAVGAVLSERMQSRKMFVCVSAIIHRLCFALMFLAPVVTSKPVIRIIWVVTFFSLAQGLGQLIGPPAATWRLSLTNRRIRGRYYSIVEKYSLIANALTGLIMGYVIDKFIAADSAASAYTVLACVSAVAAVWNFISLLKVKEPKPAMMPSKAKFSDLLLPFKNLAFLPVLIFGAIWSMSTQIIAPYEGIFYIGPLKLSYTFIMVVNTIVIIYRAYIVKFWGRYADKTSWVNVIRKGLIIMCAARLILAFLNPVNAKPLYIIGVVIANTSWAVMNIAVTNLQFDFAPSEGMNLYISIYAIITGFLGFFATFIGSFVMNLSSAVNLTFCGFKIAGQQILFLLAALLTLVSYWYIAVFIKQPSKKRLKRA